MVVGWSRYFHKIKIKQIGRYKPGDNSDTGVLEGVGLWPICNMNKSTTTKKLWINTSYWILPIECRLIIERNGHCWPTYLDALIGGLDYGRLDFVCLMAYQLCFRFRRLALVQLSSFSCTWNGDFETKFSPAQTGPNKCHSRTRTRKMQPNKKKKNKNIREEWKKRKKTYINKNIFNRKID